MTRVLIVEDEESLADPLAFLLRKEGFEATIVGLARPCWVAPGLLAMKSTMRGTISARNREPLKTP